MFNQVPPVLEAGGAEDEEATAWTGEDTEAEAEAVAELEGDGVTEAAGPEEEADADVGVEADADADEDADATNETLRDRKTRLETTDVKEGVLVGAARGAEGPGGTGTGRRVTGTRTGRAVTMRIGCRVGGFCCAGAGFSSLASWLKAKLIPFWRMSLPAS